MNAQPPLSSGLVTVSGAPDGFDACLIAEFVARHGGPVLHVARDDARMLALNTSLSFVAPEVPVLTFPAWDCLPFDRISPNSEISAARMAMLAALASGLDRPCVILTSYNAASQLVPAREVVRASSFVADVGRQIDVDALKAFLVRVGYASAPTVTEPGDFAVRGGIIDIFPPGSELPVRLDLFGDVLDGARRFDPVSQRTVEKIARIELAPASEVLLDDASIERFRHEYRNIFGAAGMDDQLYASVSEGRKYQGMEHWVPLFHEEMETLFDYLPGAPVIVDDRVEAIAQARSETIADLYDARQAALGDKSGLSSVYKPLPPERLYMDGDAWSAALSGRVHRQLIELPLPTGAGVTDAGGRIGRDFAPERQQEKISLFGALSEYIRAMRETAQVVICSYSQGSRERFGTMLSDAGIDGGVEIASLGDVPDGAGGLYLAVWPLDQGFVARGQVVITEQDILGDRLVRGARKRKRAENYLTEATTLTPGDLVVHIEHGVGRFTGLETITAAGAPHECIALEYAGEARLYLPVENIELLSRYGHDEGMLDRLGGGAWQAKKAKLKDRIREMADKLIRVAAERALRKAPVMEPPEGAWESFCARFPYNETEDQLNAIEDVLEDLASGTPMDRLVCGDVGFGKTEVALRAAFIGAMSGAQVAIIAPTTLLSRQHFKGFAERFRGLPIKVRQLSRFVSHKDAEKTREGLARGDVDIVIGTHALLAKGMRFANLGLLIVDEEQHFGVAHAAFRWRHMRQARADVAHGLRRDDQAVYLPPVILR